MIFKKCATSNCNLGIKEDSVMFEMDMDEVFKLLESRGEKE